MSEYASTSLAMTTTTCTTPSYNNNNNDGDNMAAPFRSGAHGDQGLEICFLSCAQESNRHLDPLP